MTATDYEIARLMSLALLLFAIFCGPAYLAERKRNSTKEQDNDQ